MAGRDAWLVRAWMSTIALMACKLLLKESAAWATKNWLRCKLSRNRVQGMQNRHPKDGCKHEEDPQQWSRGKGGKIQDLTETDGREG